MGRRSRSLSRGRGRNRRASSSPRRRRRSSSDRPPRRRRHSSSDQPRRRRFASSSSSSSSSSSPARRRRRSRLRARAGRRSRSASSSPGRRRESWCAGRWSASENESDTFWLVDPPYVFYHTAGARHPVDSIRFTNTSLDFVLPTAAGPCDVTLEPTDQPGVLSGVQRMGDSEETRFRLVRVGGAAAPVMKDLNTEYALAYQSGDTDRANGLARILQAKAYQEHAMQAVESAQVMRRVVPEQLPHQPEAKGQRSKEDRRRQREARRQLMEVFGGEDSDDEAPAPQRAAPAKLRPGLPRPRARTPPLACSTQEKPLGPARGTAVPEPEDRWHDDEGREALVKDAKWWGKANAAARRAWVAFCTKHGGSLNPLKYSSSQLREAVSEMKVCAKESAIPRHPSALGAASPHSDRPPADAELVTEVAASPHDIGLKLAALMAAAPARKAGATGGISSTKPARPRFTE